MDFDISEEQQMLLSTVKRMVDEKIKNRAGEIDEKDEFPWDVFELFRSNGILTMIIPQEYGGMGADLTTVTLVIEEVAKVSATSSLIITSQTLGYLLLEAGTHDQKNRTLKEIALGNKNLITIGATEPGGGSDVASIVTKAVLNDDRYLINGSKCFSSYGSIADFIVVLAKTDPRKKIAGMSIFIMERDTPGLTISKSETMLGMRGTPNVSLFFEDAVVNRENLLGAEGDGFGITMKCFDKSRPLSGAMAVGIAQGAFEYALNYSKERVLFGKPVVEFQGIQFMLAEMCTNIEVSRSLLYRVTSMIDKGDAKDISKFASMIKYFSSDVAMQVTVNAVQILGGHGYTKEHPVERMMRDAKATQIFEGPTEVQKRVIGRYILSGM